MALYLEEFLWRGRPPGSKQPGAYHVILGEVREDAFGRESITLSDAMTQEEAAALGFDLAAIVEQINTAALIERDQAVAHREATESERDAALNAKNEAEIAVQAASAERHEAVQQAAAAVAAKEAAEAERDAALAEKLAAAALPASADAV